MCGIAGAIALHGEPVERLGQRLAVMSSLLQHRGPDGRGEWLHPRRHVGFAHRRLAIIDLTTGCQPMTDGLGNWITYNGEIYNYLELRSELGPADFRTTSDTEVILRAYRRWGRDCLTRLRGMFAFALWDEEAGELFCARDRFGIKPFYFVVVDGVLSFASEIKALLPFLGRVETDLDGLKDYLAFQFCLGGKTMFRDVRELLPGHRLVARGRTMEQSCYWDVYYNLDFDHTEKYFEERTRQRLRESVRLHLRSDVPVGAYLSGGLDSSSIAAMAAVDGGPEFEAFTGRFTCGPGYDESSYARAVAESCGFPLHELEITAGDFVANLRNVIYHLDQPVAGPGSFPQYMVSRFAARRRKVVLGGQGGDEIFGGYVRYLIAYFEQCIKAAIDGTMHNGNFIVTYESIIPNLCALREYKPLLKRFWQEGLFEDLDRRYFRLIDRTPDFRGAIDWAALGDYSPYETFRGIFAADNVRKESYFDLMTHFDFKTLLPALLHVEDRVSMAHGLESRVPMLDHEVVELAATMPSNIKFKEGAMKHILKKAMRDVIPPVVARRTDKMGFPVPLTEWLTGEARGFVEEVLSSSAALSRALVDNRAVLASLDREPRFGRGLWGLLCLELWQQEFHDREHELRAQLRIERVSPAQEVHA
jgi:asparagine synthase (glutamine-hydrolysing)